MCAASTPITPTPPHPKAYSSVHANGGDFHLERERAREREDERWKVREIGRRRLKEEAVTGSPQFVVYSGYKMLKRKRGTLVFD